MVRFVTGSTFDAINYHQVTAARRESESERVAMAIQTLFPFPRSLSIIVPRTGLAAPINDCCAALIRFPMLRIGCLFLFIRCGEQARLAKTKKPF